MSFKCNKCDVKVSSRCYLYKHLLIRVPLSDQGFQLCDGVGLLDVLVCIQRQGGDLLGLLLVLDGDVASFIREEFVNLFISLELSDMKAELISPLGQHEIEENVGVKVLGGLDGSSQCVKGGVIPNPESKQDCS